jgi:apoptosis-inducing factor 3
VRWQRVARVSDVPPGAVRRVVVDRLEIALVNLDGELFAVDDVCTHAFASLSEGALVGGELECPLHGGCFDVRTGAAKGGIVTEDLRRFAVRVEGDDVLISLGDGA